MNKLLEMRSFVTVVDAGSFVGAAEALGLSKPAVSRHVAELAACACCTGPRASCR